jgi:hypothetical protein
MTLLGIAAPALLLALALRRWFAPLPWSAIAIAFGLTVGFLHGAIFTTKVPVPLDEVMRGYPYRGVIGAPAPRNALTNDTVKQILPWMQTAREELLRGHAPLWNPYQFSGYPLLANGQSAPFAPLFLATLFVPLPQQLVAMAGLKIFLALIFGWLFLRDEGVSQWAALFGSAAFAFSVFQTVYLYYPLTTVTSLLPAAAFAVRGCVRHREKRWIVLLAIVTAAVASSGHPESAAHIGLACAIVLLLEGKNPARAIAAAILGLALAAPAWVPVIEQALRSTRAATLATAPHATIRTTAAWLLLNPDGFGNPSRGNWQWLYNYSVVAPMYLGLLPLALAFAARKKRELLLVAIAAVLFLIAMNWTFIGHAFNAVPPMNLIAQDRLRFVVLFFVAIVAARVVDRWSAAAAVAALPILGAAIWLLHNRWGIALGPQSAAGVIALALFLIVAIARPRLAPIAAACAIVVELFTFNAGFNALVPRAYFAPKLPILEKARELARGEPSRTVGHDWTLMPNAASQYQLEDVRGSDPMASADYARFFERIAADDPSSDVLRVQDTDHPALPFLGVRFLMTDSSFTPPTAWQLRYEGPDGKLYESTRWQRRFFAPRGDARIGRIVQERPSRVTVEIDAPNGAFIASSQSAAPGWRVHGATNVVRLHDAFLGFRVAPGRHVVTLTYAPSSFYWSLLATLLALGALARSSFSPRHARGEGAAGG